MATPIAALTPEQRAEIEQWLEANSAQIPNPVRVALKTHALLIEALIGGARDLTKLLNSLRRAMGIDPKSERQGRSSQQVDAEKKQPRRRSIDAAQRLQEKYAQLEARGQWHRDRLRKGNKEMKSIQNQITQAKKNPGKEVPKIKLDLTATEEEKQQMAEESKALRKRFELGGEPDPSLSTAHEALMTGNVVTLSQETRKLEIAPERLEGLQVRHRRVDTRVRYDFSLSICRLDLEVEKTLVVTPDGERKTLCASTREIGPARFSVTWKFLVNLTMMTSLYAVPMNRIARMLTSDERKFNASGLCKMLQFVAWHLAPIYLHLFDQLSDTDIMLGDDTNNRVLEATRHFARGKDHEGAPWADWPERNEAIKDKDEKSDGLCQMLARELGFKFPYRNGKAGFKRALHTTVLAGRSVADDPKSFIIFYRSHFGSLGNLIEVAMERRDPAKRKLIIQCDLATVNLVADPKLCEEFEIVIAGCLAHARRPFVRHKREDPDLCRIMLDYFAGLAFLEEGLDEYGRNQENVKAVREVDGREVWEVIKELAKIMKLKWSDSTKLGEAANYILNHEKELEYYLSDPRLAADNNLSERMIRMERIIENNSMFRVSFKGRCALDITRTIGQTAIAADVPVAEYFEAMLRTPYHEIASAPERYTPYAWARQRQLEAEQS